MAEAKTADTKDTEPKSTEVKEAKKYKLLKNIKYGDTPYKIGEKIEIAVEHIEEFVKAQIIKIEED